MNIMMLLLEDSPENTDKTLFLKNLAVLTEVTGKVAAHILFILLLEICSLFMM